MQRVAAQYLTADQRVVVWSVPKKEGTGLRPPEPGGAPQPSAAGRGLPRRRGGVGEFSLKKTQRVVLPNGLTLLLYEQRRLPIVFAEAYVRNVVLREPADKAGVAALVANMLSEGTSAHSGPQIAEMIENVGGLLSLTATGGSVKVLTPDRKLGLGLLFECLARANFPKDPLERSPRPVDRRHRGRGQAARQPRTAPSTASSPTASIPSADRCSARRATSPS